jgi:hypothetical protein
VVYIRQPDLLVDMDSADASRALLAAVLFRVGAPSPDCRLLILDDVDVGSREKTSAVVEVLQELLVGHPQLRILATADRLVSGACVWEGTGRE